MLYKRKLAKPAKSFFLFGPRGTGKSTWLRQNFPCAHTIIPNFIGLMREYCVRQQGEYSSRCPPTGVEKLWKHGFSMNCLRISTIQTQEVC